MKTEDLQAKGLTEEQISFVMAENGKDINREKQRADDLKAQLDTAKQGLKSFEGVDLNELNGKIAQLTADLEAKDNEYKGKLADMEFGIALDAAIAKSKPVNPAHVKAVLAEQLEELKKSKNQAADIDAAIEKIRGESAYLFVSDEPIQNPVGRTDGAKPAAGRKMTVSEVMKYKNEHPDADIAALMGRQTKTD